LQIRTRDGHVTASFLAIPTQRKDEVKEAHFIFHRYGTEYFLEKIWTPDQNVGWDVMQGKLEHELAKKMTITETATLIGH
jgi:hypothetical protein